LYLETNEITFIALIIYNFYYIALSLPMCSESFMKQLKLFSRNVANTWGQKHLVILLKTILPQ